MRPLALAVGLLLLAPLAAATGEDDCDTGSDAPDYGDGVVVALPADCRATFSAADDWDSYRFAVPHGLDLAVRIVPDEPGQVGVVCLYGPRALNPFTCKVGVAGVRSHDPRLWGARVYLCADATCERYGRGDYALSISASGTPSPSTVEDGAIAVGVPLGPHAAKAAPDTANGLDGSWHDLARPSRNVDFLRIAWEGCDGCLNLNWHFPTGQTLSSSCTPAGPGTLECRAAIGADRLLVGASSGTDLAYRLQYWYAQG